MEHVDYPHEPGMLYDCPPCEVIMDQESEDLATHYDRAAWYDQDS